MIRIKRTHQMECNGEEQSDEAPPTAGLRSFSAKGGSALGMTGARNDKVKLFKAFAIVMKNAGSS